MEHNYHTSHNLRILSPITVLTVPFLFVLPSLQALYNISSISKLHAVFGGTLRDNIIFERAPPPPTLLSLSLIAAAVWISSPFMASILKLWDNRLHKKEIKDNSLLE